MAAYKRLTSHVVNIDKVGKYGLEKKVFKSVKEDPGCQKHTMQDGKHFYRFLPYLFLRKRRELASEEE